MDSATEEAQETYKKAIEENDIEKVSRLRKILKAQGVLVD